MSPAKTWTNVYEDVACTIKELQTITGVVDNVITVCVKRNLHTAYHALTLANEVLKRRTEYLQQVASKDLAFPTDRLTYPTHFLCDWLKFVTIRKETTKAVCNRRCAQLFKDGQPDGDNGSVVVLNDTYPLGEPFTCGPSKPAPNSKNIAKRPWTDVYELKYVYCALKNSIDFLKVDGPIEIMLHALIDLLLIRYKTRIGYSPGVGNNLLQENRCRFYKALDEFKEHVLLTA